tara:strand:+ start:3777 stop:4760 length:984 start_codon:yes stop_codon:yes gene_type:complete
MNNKNVLVTGATGSFGKAFLYYSLKKYKNIKKLVIYSRDELKQFELSQSIEEKYKDKIRFFLGDVRDKDRLKFALKEIDIVVHAAALKQVPAAEYNPFEFIKTNVLGAQNIIDACLETNVQKVIALSTDKAAAPINLYGATKLCSDKLFIAANNVVGKKKISFSVVRYGNVANSRGSVIPFFLKEKEKKILPITDKRMTRFNITLLESVKMVDWAIKNTIGGEIIVPKIPSYNIVDLAKAVCEKCKIKYVGIRPGEKLHEDLITVADSPNTFDIGPYYAILMNQSEKLIAHYKKRKAKKVKDNFSYNSENNNKFLSIKELKDLIKDY